MLQFNPLFKCAVLLILIVVFSSCIQNQNGRKDEPSQHIPTITFIPENQATAIDSIQNQKILQQEELQAFEREWLRVSPMIVATAHPDSLIKISKYAREQMKALTLPLDWAEKLSNRQLGFTQDTNDVWFGQSNEEGYPLPSHHPLVYRRLLVCTKFNRSTQAIDRVLITIRGWVEE